MDRDGSRRRSIESGSKIPVPSPSAYYTPTPVRKRPPTLDRHRSLQSLGVFNHKDRDDDTDSVQSFGSHYSNCSTASVQCSTTHSPFGKNGTTYSGRQKKYIVHCSTPNGSPELYQTPTQRATATIRHLKSLLNESKNAIDEKEKEIAHLTKELVKLRLKQADTEVDSPVKTPVTINGPSLESPIDVSAYAPTSASCTLLNGGGSPVPVSTSLSDSGHFEDISPHPSPRAFNVLEREIEKMKHQHEEEVKALKEGADAQVTTLVNRLAEANDRNFDMNAQLNALQAKIDQLEKEREELVSTYKENEEKHKSTYLEMFNKGLQAAVFQNQPEDSPEGSPISIPNLIKQLEITKSELDNVKDKDFWSIEKLLSGKEAVSLWNICRKTMYKRLLESKQPKKPQDAEVTLQFLKSAIYYFLTDRENAAGHLAAIQSILGFTQDEKHAIDKATTSASSYVGWK